MNDLADCIKELKAENKRLFDAHAVEMVRADKLKGALEFETERANGLAKELERLQDALHEIAGTSYSREVAADIAKQALEQGDVPLQGD